MRDDILDTVITADVHEIRRRDGGPMRDVLKLHPNMEVRMFPSWKTGRPVYTTGALELAWRDAFEADPQVADYRSQPLTLVFVLDGQTVSYTPDFEVVRAREEVVETKFAHTLARNPKTAAVLTRVREIYRARGIPFRILGREQLPNAAWMEAAADIADLGRTRIDPLDAYAVTAFLRRNSTSTLDRVAGVVRHHDDPIRAVISLALRPRSIVIDMNGPVTPATKIRLRTGAGS